MKSTFFTVALCIVLPVALFPIDALSQPVYSQPVYLQTNCAEGGQSIAKPTPLTSNQRVGFRMVEWNVIHGTDPLTTDETIATLESIGCEVIASDNGNHRHIRFRCADWSSIPVSNAEQASQWLGWLTNNDFETLVLNPVNDPRMPTVQYRRAGIQKFHARSQAEVNAIAKTYEMLGCLTEVTRQSNHVEVRVSCPDWTTIGLPNEQSAQTWQTWLNENGFETRHNHTQQYAGSYPVQRAAYPQLITLQREPIGTTAFGTPGSDEVRAGYSQYTQAGPLRQNRARNSSGCSCRN